MLLFNDLLRVEPSDLDETGEPRHTIRLICYQALLFITFDFLDAFLVACSISAAAVAGGRVGP